MVLPDSGSPAHAGIYPSRQPGWRPSQRFPAYAGIDLQGQPSPPRTVYSPAHAGIDHRDMARRTGQQRFPITSWDSGRPRAACDKSVSASRRPWRSRLLQRPVLPPTSTATFRCYSPTGLKGAGYSIAATPYSVSSDQYVGNLARGDEGVVDSEHDLLRLHCAAGVAEVVGHRAPEAGEGGVHGLPEHPPGRHAEAGDEEAAELPHPRGELPEDGLTAYGDDGEDLTPARKIVSWEVDDGWKVVGSGAGEHHCRRDKIH